MLRYKNEELSIDNILEIDKNEKVFNPITFRLYDWNTFYDKLIKLLEVIGEHPSIEKMELNIYRVYAKSRNQVEETVYDKEIEVKYYQRKLSEPHIIKIIVPKMLKMRFLLNGVSRFATYQIVDLPLIVRDDQLRIANNIRHLIVYTKKEDKSNNFRYYVNRSKKVKIPFIALLLARFGVEKTNEILEKRNLAQIKLKNDYPKTISKATEILEYKILNSDSNIKYIMKDLELIELSTTNRSKQKFSKKLWLEYVNRDINYDFIQNWIDIENIDIFTKELLKEDNYIEELLNGIDEVPYDTNDLSKKRVRSLEYILAYLMNDIYENLYQQFNGMRKPRRRNLNLVDIMVGKHFQELLQLSKLDTNIVASLMELYKCTYTGYGALDKDSIQIYTRDIHWSYYRKLDPIFTPDGDKCGVVNYLTIDCKLDKFGRFID